jgi:hypothetical protein
MKVFKDIFSGDEMFSDSYPHESVHGAAMWRVKSKYVPKDDNIVIHEKGAFDADEPEDTGAVEMVNNIIDSFHLQEVQLTKKDFMAYVKGYLKRSCAWLKENGKEDRVKDFQKGATEAVKFIVGKHDEFQFYVGQSFDMEAGLGMAW